MVRWTTDLEYIDLLNFLIVRTENVESPINIIQLVREFKEKSGTSQTLTCLKRRIERMRTMIQGFEHIDTDTKVKLMFALSASVDTDFLEELKKNALLEVDEKNRIVQYKANDGSLELSGDHSMSAKVKIAMREIELKRNYRKWISDYFENKNDAVAVPKNKKKKEMWNLIEFITRKCVTADSPLSICQLTKDFNNHFGISRSAMTIRTRVKAYCNEIQGIESLDALTIIKQLFCLSATLNPDLLQELRKDALVEVDHKNRITKYTANNGHLTLHGDHSRFAKRKLALRERRKTKNPVKKHCNPDGDKSEDSEKDNRYSEDDSEESEDPGSELYSENEDDHSNYSIDNQVKLEPFRGSIQEMFDELKGDEDIQQIPKPPQPHDEQNQFEEAPIKEEPEEPKIVENPTEDVKPEIAQAHDKHKELIEFPIKLEHEEPLEVKPETSHNFRIKFFEAMQSLILCLDTPSLSWIQSKIHQKIQKLKESDEVILDNEILLTIESLISQLTNDSVVNLSETAESVNFSNFLCYLKAAILNSKMSGLQGLVKNISELIEELQNKRIPIEKVANVLRSTLDIDSF